MVRKSSVKPLTSSNQSSWLKLVKCLRSKAKPYCKKLSNLMKVMKVFSLFMSSKTSILNNLIVVHGSSTLTTLKNKIITTQCSALCLWPVLNTVWKSLKKVSELWIKMQTPKQLCPRLRLKDNRFRILNKPPTIFKNLSFPIKTNLKWS